MNTLNPEGIRRALTEFNFKKLFVDELGWEAPRAAKFPTVGGAQVREVAHLGGIPALEVVAEEIPDAKARRAIHTEISRLAHENLLLFVDEARQRTLWYWVKREGGKAVPREHHFVHGQPGDLFLSKLAALFVDIEEYDDGGAFSVLKAGQRLKAALDVSKVTKKFYAAFTQRHLEFLELIQGIDSDLDRRWYASVLLNRLMFVYFLQKKGFLDDGDFDYLRHRFAHHRGDLFAGFLLPLFFTGFARPDDDPAKKARHAQLGRIPYLNGGLFLPHGIELKYGDRIRIPDRAFENVLRLFESYSWNLNDVPGAADDELNPDVLGYIFEKYINDQKSAGAYYTPPEITGYLCERTIHDLVLERVQSVRSSAVRRVEAVEDAPHGATTNATNANLYVRRYESIGDLLLELDAESCRVTLEVLDALRLCDPAVGSGAFLVAALKTLTNLYGALWGRAEVLGDDNLKTQIVGDAKAHRAPFYAIRKRIITRNLFGVDIMEEATEIARLRLFLSLVASAKTVDELEPLPNIEFNILPGNSLIGLLEVGEKDFASGGLFVKARYDELCAKKERAVHDYKELAGHGFGELSDLKQRAEGLREQMGELCDGALLEQFNKYKIQYESPDLVGAHAVRPYGGHKGNKRPLDAADIARLKPFHWGYEFSEVMEQGGFDAIITNPPWEVFQTDEKEFFQRHDTTIQKKKIRIEDWKKRFAEFLKDPELGPKWLEYASEFPHVSAYFKQAPEYENQISLVNGRTFGGKLNLYALFTERCFRLLQDGGRAGIVIPSGIYTDLGAKHLREMLFGQTQVSGLFCFENRKEIFEGVHRSYKFVVLTFRKGGKTREFPAAFMRHDVHELENFPTRDSLPINVDLVRQLSPDSLSVMEFKSERDVEIAQKMLHFPLLGQKIEGVWNLSLMQEFNMTTDSHLFQTTPGEGRLRLFEGKMMHHFRHDLAKPRYWVDEKAGRKALRGRQIDTGETMPYQAYRLAFRDIARNTDERTMIATVLPPNVFMGNTLPTALPTLSVTELLFLVATLDSFVFDWMIRQKVSAHCNFFYVYQMPVSRLTEKDKAFGSIVERAARLICTTPEFDALWASVHDSVRSSAVRRVQDGADAPTTNPVERARLRAELDALVAHLYGLSEDEFAHILSMFPLVPDPVKLAARNAYRDVERGLIP